MEWISTANRKKTNSNSVHELEAFCGTHYFHLLLLHNLQHTKLLTFMADTKSETITAFQSQISFIDTRVTLLVLLFYISKLFLRRGHHTSHPQVKYIYLRSIYSFEEKKAPTPFRFYSSACCTVPFSET